MGFMAKLKEAKNKTTVKAFTLGEEADQLGRKAAKLDKKLDKSKEETNQVRALRKEAEQVRAQQQQAQALNQQMGLGEKILRAYFTYKLASLACRTLVGLTGNYYNSQNQAVGQAITSGIDRASDKMADAIEKSPELEGEDVNQHRAAMIEETLNSFQHMSDEAARQGITEESRPLLADEDKTDIQELADASRENDIEQYTAKCQDLGLNATEARAAFEQDRTIDTVQNDIEKDQTAKIDQMAPTIEM